MANRFLSNIRVNDAYTLPSADGSAGQAIITDGAGNLSFGTVSSEGGSSSSVVYRENFTGDGTTTDFTLTRTITDENITQVYIDGVYQEKDAYSVTGLNTISFSAAPPSGDSIEVMYFYALDAIPQPSTSVIYRDNFTGDGTTTQFTLANSIEAEDHTQVYIDGAYQEKGTYAAVGTTLTFDTAPALGHSVEVISIAALTRDYSPTTIYQDNFTGDGTTVAFTMQNAVDDEVKTMVYFDGVYQFKGTYAVDGVTITFDAAPASGVDVEVITIASARGFEYNAQTLYFYGKASENFSKGDAIMFAGQQGDHFLFAKATQAAIAANHEYFIGLATQDLTTGEFGYVTEFGNVTGLDTTTYTAGDILWFDAGGTTAGALTNVEPAPPLVKIQVAAVIREHQEEGILFVRPTWYHELGELHDVNITSVADKDMLVWDNANGYWENSKTLGDITATSLVVDTDTLYVDAVNNKVGIGVTNPFGALTVKAPTGLGSISVITGTTTADSVRLESGGSITNYLEYRGYLGHVWFNDTGEQMRIDSAGNVGIGTSSPVAKLDVLGTFAISNSAFSSWIFDRNDSDGSLTISDGVSEKIRINSSGNLGLNTSNPLEIIHINANSDSDTKILFSENDTVATSLFYEGSAGGGTANKFHIRRELSGLESNLVTVGMDGNVGIGTSSPIQKVSVPVGSTQFNIGTDQYGNAHLTSGASDGNQSYGINLQVGRPTSLVRDKGASINLYGNTQGGPDAKGSVYIMTSNDQTITSGNHIRFWTTSPTQSNAERMRITSAGQITTPYQPAFEATALSATSSGNTIGYDFIITNRGNHYNSTTGRFTAPVSGNYFFSWSSIANNSVDVYRYYIRVNNANYNNYHLRIQTDTTLIYGNGTRSIIIPLNAGDYVSIYFISDGGSQSYGGGAYSSFNGYLLG